MVKQKPLPPNTKLFDTSVRHPNGTVYCVTFSAPSFEVAKVLNEAMGGDPERWGETVWIGDVVADGTITEWGSTNEEDKDE